VELLMDNPGGSPVAVKVSPLGGRTILLYMEQGLGDMLQFIRYASLICVAMLVRKCTIDPQRSPGELETGSDKTVGVKSSDD
jgi:hypothetical protein